MTGVYEREGENACHDGDGGHQGLSLEVKDRRNALWVGR